MIVRRMSDINENATDEAVMLGYHHLVLEAILLRIQQKMRQKVPFLRLFPNAGRHKNAGLAP